MPCGRTMASGSTLGRVMSSWPVATLFTQSVEPGRGTISMPSPSCLNHPIFTAMAKGEPTPMDTVRAQIPTRSFVCA